MLKLSNACLIKFSLGYFDLMLTVSASAGAYACTTALKHPHSLYFVLVSGMTQMPPVCFLFINVL